MAVQSVPQALFAVGLACVRVQAVRKHDVEAQVFWFFGVRDDLVLVELILHLFHKTVESVFLKDIVCDLILFFLEVELGERQLAHLLSDRQPFVDPLEEIPELLLLEHFDSDLVELLVVFVDQQSHKGPDESPEFPEFDQLLALNLVDLVLHDVVLLYHLNYLLLVHLLVEDLLLLQLEPILLQLALVTLGLVGEVLKAFEQSFLGLLVVVVDELDVLEERLLLIGVLDG